MSNEYTLFITDEFDWNYANTNKNTSLELLKSSNLGTVIATFPYWIIYNTGKNHPAYDNELLSLLKKLLFDNFYIQTDNNIVLESYINISLTQDI